MQLTLIRSGRRYELRRGEEVVGEVRRRGVLRQRYEADFGGRTWHYRGAGRKLGVNLVFDADGRERAGLEASKAGYGIVLDDEPVNMTLATGRDGSSEWVDERGTTLLRLVPADRAGAQKNGLVATLEQTEQRWPGSDPDAAHSVAAATICAWFVQDLDAAGIQQFNRQMML